MRTKPFEMSKTILF